VIYDDTGLFSGLYTNATGGLYGGHALSNAVLSKMNQTPTTFTPTSAWTAETNALDQAVLNMYANANSPQASFVDQTIHDFWGLPSDPGAGGGNYGALSNPPVY
jgi:hypothetical protein